ncbi:MAG TPA: hypothetical protein VK081_11540, partial [Planctomycetota bacterium]|nr:hypothetical protein [Planctomycetota bacterium]
VHGPFAQGSPDAAALDAWHRTYSDHFPLTVDLDARRDQDPSATFRPARAGQELRPGGGSAASTPAAPVQPAQPVPPPQPAQGYFGLRPGMHVQVRLIDDRVFEGTLVSPLGPDWIEIDAGYLIAFPTRNVLSVRAK